MKKYVKIAVLVIIGLIFVGTFGFLYISIFFSTFAIE